MDEDQLEIQYGRQSLNELEYNSYASLNSVRRALETLRENEIYN